MSSKDTQAALQLATELGGRLLLEQVSRTTQHTIDGLKEILTDEQLTDVRRVLVTSLMANLFNPAYAESDHVNGLTMTREIVQVGYNTMEPICYTPVQKIINIHKG